jgi:site-specific recombinase XerD
MQTEVKSLFSHMSDKHALIANLLYGTGLRLMECMCLRVKNVDFARCEITIRSGKGGKDRLTMLPLTLVNALREHLVATRALFDEDRTAKRTGAMLPNALERKYPRAAVQWGWFWSFPLTMSQPIHVQG